MLPLSRLGVPEMLITPEYAALNAALHASNPAYGTSGGKWAVKVHRLARQYEASTVLDYGAGKGTLYQEMLHKHASAPDISEEGARRTFPFVLFEYDPAVPGKDAPPGRADLVVCGDVLEHIEPECLYSVLDDLRSLAKKAVLLIVATRPAVKTLADGRNAHLIVEPAEWWFPKLALRWRIRTFEDRGPFFLCLGEAR